MLFSLSGPSSQTLISDGKLKKSFSEWSTRSPQSLFFVLIGTRSSNNVEPCFNRNAAKGNVKSNSRSLVRLMLISFDLTFFRIRIFDRN